MYAQADSLQVFSPLTAAVVITMLIAFVIKYVALWKIFEKVGCPGWKAIVPVYNLYTLRDIVFSIGWAVLLFLIPLYSIYMTFKLYIMLAYKFGKSTAFGVGLVFLYPIFLCILAFGKSECIQ